MRILDTLLTTVAIAQLGSASAIPERVNATSQALVKRTGCPRGQIFLYSTPASEIPYCLGGKFAAAVLVPIIGYQLPGIINAVKGQGGANCDVPKTGNLLPTDPPPAPAPAPGRTAADAVTSSNNTTAIQTVSANKQTTFSYEMLVGNNHHSCDVPFTAEDNGNAIYQAIQYMGKNQYECVNFIADGLNESEIKITVWEVTPDGKNHRTC